jgi:N-glycosylase/DNA lyase
MRHFVLKPDHFDLELTLTCGQTFCWHRTEGSLYEGGSDKFYTFKDGKPIMVEERSEGIKAVTEHDREVVEEALGIDHDLQEIFDEFPEMEKLELARDEFWGLRVIQDDFFPCTISYLCSPQMRIPRIKEMFNEMARKYGETVEFNGHELLRFPTQEEMSEVTEEELREIGVGYRAKYIVETMKIFQEKDFDPEKTRSMDYEAAREEMKRLYGVGDKVADCILLFSLGFHEATPIDTWGLQALEQHFPELHSEDYDEISENMRNKFGDKAGYAQEYIFHAMRNELWD